VPPPVDSGFDVCGFTGGEPLLNGLSLDRCLQPFVILPAAPAASCRTIALTTNGAAWGREAGPALKAAGLDRITISLRWHDGRERARMAGSARPSAREALRPRCWPAVEQRPCRRFARPSGQLKLKAVDPPRGATTISCCALAALARAAGGELRCLSSWMVGQPQRL